MELIDSEDNSDDNVDEQDDNGDDDDDDPDDDDYIRVIYEVAKRRKCRLPKPLKCAIVYSTDLLARYFSTNLKEKTKQKTSILETVKCSYVLQQALTELGIIG